MLISQATLNAYVGPDPARVLALYERSGSAELCLSYWSETLTPDGLRKILQTARATNAKNAAEKAPRHHRKLTIEREEEIVAALSTAECVADVARDQRVSEQVIYRICRERGIAWPVLSPERRAERIRAVHAEMRAARVVAAAPMKRKPVQLDLVEWIAAQEPSL